MYRCPMHVGGQLDSDSSQEAEQLIILITMNIHVIRLGGSRKTENGGRGKHLGNLSVSDINPKSDNIVM